MQDCFELIDSGISVLILIPRDARKANEILAYAKKKNVKVISYARAVMGEDIEFFCGLRYLQDRAEVWGCILQKRPIREILPF